MSIILKSWCQHFPTSNFTKTNEKGQEFNQSKEYQYNFRSDVIENTLTLTLTAKAPKVLCSISLYIIALYESFLTISNFSN